MCKKQLLILFYSLKFGVDSVYGQKNALYITCLIIKEKIIRGVIAHSRLCIREKVATTVPKRRVVNKDKTL